MTQAEQAIDIGAANMETTGQFSPANAGSQEGIVKFHLGGLQARQPDHAVILAAKFAGSWDWFAAFDVVADDHLQCVDRHLDGFLFAVALCYPPFEIWKSATN